MNHTLKGFDLRIVSLRKECDIENLRGLIRAKADVVSVAADFENHEFKIGTLDRNLVCIANDFTVFQKAINKMHTSVKELQEVNKEVLLGKKRLNCLSCGAENSKDNVTTGMDGRVYKTNQGTSMASS